jgi:adenylylsulfate kinase-like enzyme
MTLGFVPPCPTLSPRPGIPSPRPSPRRLNVGQSDSRYRCSEATDHRRRIPIRPRNALGINLSRFQSAGRDHRRVPRRTVILLSGPIRAGKTTLADHIGPKLSADRVRTKGILLDEYGARPEVRLRLRLQELGEKLDVETDGRWVAAAVNRRLDNIPARTPVVVDAVRIPPQVAHLRKIPGARIIHVHLNAQLETLRARYAATAAGDEKELPSYDEVRANPTEARINQMRALTKLRFNTTFVGPRLISLIVLTVVRVSNAVDAGVQLAYAFALGLPGALISLLAAWFWFDHLDRLAAAIVSVGIFVFFATLSGAALTRFSPVERDTPERPRAPLPASPPQRVPPPSGPEVEKSRTLTQATFPWGSASLVVLAALLDFLSTQVLTPVRSSEQPTTG